MLASLSAPSIISRKLVNWEKTTAWNFGLAYWSALGEGRITQIQIHSLALTRSRRLSNSLILVLSCKVSRCASGFDQPYLATKSVFPSHFDPLACFFDAALLCEDEDAADADLCDLSEQITVLRVLPTLIDRGKETRQSCARACCPRLNLADLSQVCCRSAFGQCL